MQATRFELHAAIVGEGRFAQRAQTSRPLRINHQTRDQCR